jgi:hypothetical protein
MRDRPEPWRRFEAVVDPDGTLEAKERERRAKISYKAAQRRAAACAAKTRAAKKKRREAAIKRALQRPITDAEIAEMQEERREYVRVVTVLLAAERGYTGMLKLIKNQPRQRADCVLCGRRFEP